MGRIGPIGIIRPIALGPVEDSGDSLVRELRFRQETETMSSQTLPETQPPKPVAETAQI